MSNLFRETDGFYAIGSTFLILYGYTFPFFSMTKFMFNFSLNHFVIYVIPSVDFIFFTFESGTN